MDDLSQFVSIGLTNREYLKKLKREDRSNMAKAATLVVVSVLVGGVVIIVANSLDKYLIEEK